MIRFSIAIACALFVWVGGTLASSLTILYTNDLHTRLGRLEGLAELIESERAMDRPVLLLDAGDTWQDFRTPLAAVWGAEEMVDWMNKVRYDAMALGNHDLYWGADQLVALCERASRQGKRVLVASQANVAVDNVLARLSKDPAVRAVRISGGPRRCLSARIRNSEYFDNLPDLGN